jgi:hypothetical protein
MNAAGAVKTRSAAVPSCGQLAGSVARDIGRDTSNARPHLGQRKSYVGMSRLA